MTHLDLFSGIGGFALAAEAVWPYIEHTFCDNDLFCQEVLKKHWPQSKIHGDIRELNIGLENGTIGLCNGNARNVKNDLPRAEDRIANPATQNEWLNGATEIERTTKKRSVIGTENERTQSSNTTGANAFVVASKKKRSSPLTILTAEGILNGGPTNRKHGSSSSSVDSPRTTKSSATTATTQSTTTKYVRTTQIDLLTGGFPCQPFSHAGKRRGTKDDRFLWGEMLRTIRITHPRYVVAENVRGLLSIDGGVVFESVCADLEAIGYEVQPFLIPACAVDAPHRRDRVWIVAYRRQQHGRTGRNEKVGTDKTIGTPCVSDVKRCDKDATNTKREGHKGDEHKTGSGSRHHRGPQLAEWTEDWPQVATRLCRMDDGIPRRMDRNPRLKALGNAIVPQVAVEIFKAIKNYDRSL